MWQLPMWTLWCELEVYSSLDNSRLRSRKLYMAIQIPSLILSSNDLLNRGRRCLNNVLRAGCDYIGTTRGKSCDGKLKPLACWMEPLSWWLCSDIVRTVVSKSSDTVLTFQLPKQQNVDIFLSSLCSINRCWNMPGHLCSQVYRGGCWGNQAQLNVAA
jgi:hypothetical protein